MEMKDNSEKDLDENGFSQVLVHTVIENIEFILGKY